MSWQEGEIKKRKEKETLKEKELKERTIAKEEINKLWPKFLKANADLPRELRMTVSKVTLNDNSIMEEIKGNNRSITFHTSNGFIFLGGGSDDHVRYDLQTKRFFIYLSDDNRYHRYDYHSVCHWITDNSIHILIKNLCLGLPMASELLPN
jgi:hypothetical protein